MEWLTQLQNQIVGLDTAPLIYFVEENLDYTALVDPFFEALDRREFSVVSSVITLTEVLVYPMRAGDIDLAQQYRDILFDQENVKTVSVSPQIAELAAQIPGLFHSK
jgi:PIN domain nuclease of toxin-antitoxin system